jgi:hypothetical protein
MVNGKAPLYLTVVGLFLAVAALMLFQPYSADWPARAYTDPARQYIHAALREDSVGLLRLSSSVAPVTWGLNAARVHHDSLELWRRRIQAYTGERRGDTAEVFVYPAEPACGGAPIVFHFVGSGRKLRVHQVSSTCWGR